MKPLQVSQLSFDIGGAVIELGIGTERIQSDSDPQGAQGPHNQPAIPAQETETKRLVRRPDRD
jgi:hypothetical protein